MIKLLIRFAQNILESNGYTVIKKLSTSERLSYQTYVNTRCIPESKDMLLPLIDCYYNTSLKDLSEKYYIVYNSCNLLDCNPSELVLIKSGEEYDKFDKLSVEILIHDLSTWCIDYWINNEWFDHEIDIYKNGKHIFLKYHDSKNNMIICSCKQCMFDPDMYL